MSNTLFLDALKKYDLQQYYPSFFSQGLSTLNVLAELSMQDCTRLGVRSIDDKRKFMALAEDIKQQLRSKSMLPKKTIPSATSPQSRKRPFSTRGDKTPPEKQSRRMTLAPQTLPRNTSPKGPVRSVPVNNRRLSYLPRQPINNRSPIRATSGKPSTLSPSRPAVTSRTPPKMPKFLEELSVEVKPPEEPPQIQKQPSRLLDAYGIPITPPKRRLSNDNSTPLMTFEEYMKSRSKLSQNSSATQTFASSSDLHQKIRVCVRKRPLSRKEIALGETDVAPVAGTRTIRVNAPRTRVDLTRFTEQHSFTFDDVFDSNASNVDIYRRTALPLVEYMFAGGKATCFAYGQTGSGKTYTMLDPQHGLYVQAAHDIFAMLNKPQYSHLSAWVGFYEIYQGQLYDLLNQRKRLVPREDGNNNVVIAGLREFPISDVNRLMEVFDFGNQARTTGKTGANNNSSRSHAVLQVLIKTKADSTIHGKLSFIDLAGSERGADRGEANTKTRLEGAEINKSLLALKECIRALDQDKRHTPFRGSKLTQVLRDSFVGDSRTCMIATISPNNSNSEHTLNTLRYADRVKELKGESDPRLMAERRHPEPETMEVDTLDNREDTQSNTNSDAIWDEDQTENLLDIDIPSQMSNNALGTPQVHGPSWSTATATTPQRQEHYMRRLSSPPAEVFQTPLEDPFGSKPLLPEENPPAQADQPKKPAAGRGWDGGQQLVTAEHIRSFIKLHRAQIKELEDCIKKEKKMISKLSLTVSSHHDFNDGKESEADQEETTKLYEDYLNDLEDILECKVACVETLRERIKAELGDEEEEDIF